MSIVDGNAKKPGHATDYPIISKKEISKNNHVRCAVAQRILRHTMTITASPYKSDGCAAATTSSYIKN